jgi:hypothetical protein
MSPQNDEVVGVRRRAPLILYIVIETFQHPFIGVNDEYLRQLRANAEDIDDGSGW